MYCSECGAKIVEGSKFCSSCGKPLMGVSTSSGWMRGGAAAAVSKPKAKVKRPLWRKVLGERDRSSLRCVLGIVMWVVVLLFGMVLAHGSTGFEYFDLRTSEYVAKYGHSGLSGVQWLVFGSGILLNIVGIAMVYCWLQALLSRIRPANRTQSIWAKVAAVVICILFYCGFSLLRWYGNDCKPCWSMWDTFIVFAVCAAVWRGLVGVDKGCQSSAIFDKPTVEPGGFSTRVNDIHGKSRFGCWMIVIVGALFVIGVCVGVAFQCQSGQQERMAQQALAAFEAEDYARGLHLAAKVKDKNSRLQYFVGLCHEKGYGGVSPDDVEAVSWYRKSAEQGDAYGQFALGVKYANGQGVEKDDVEAVCWYRKAAEQGNAWAQSNLGWMYENGHGVLKNDIEAVRWYRKAAVQGNDSAQYNIGLMYANGRGVEKDDIEAVRWYRKAAEQGAVDAQYNLGVRYANGRGVEKSEVKAVYWYRKAAKQGDSGAQTALRKRNLTW